jgi:4-hydroxybenzoate polyprenyltransferase
MRPRQWAKNLLLLTGLFFARKFNDPNSIYAAFSGFTIFCALSGSIYLFNDVMDMNKDRNHPRKKLRPVASGELSPVTAMVGAGIILIIFMIWAWRISTWFGMCGSVYYVMMLAYSMKLKHVFLVDTLIIAMGFLIRAVSGVIVLRTPSTDVELTPWFVLCVLFLSLLLAFCKRRSERVSLDEEALRTRPVLACYSPQLLDMVIGISAAGAILSYALYATSFTRPWLMLTTLPFVLFGIFRYLYLVYDKGQGEAPEMVLFTDRAILVCLILWGACLVFIYMPGTL